MNAQKTAAKESSIMLEQAKFLQGDPLHHIVVMSASASVGMIAIFIVDFADLYFISLLGEAAMAAAVGYAGTLLFFTTSISLGLMIAMGSLAAQRIGSGEPEKAQRMATSVIALGLIVGIVISVIVWLFTPALLDLMGARGQTRDFAVRYVRIIVPTMVVMVGAMSCAGLLRAHGDARRPMNATLIAGGVNAVLDPLLIFGLGLGLDGAAIASVCARLAMAVFTVVPVIRHYGGFAPFRISAFIADLRPIAAITVPAILTNIATPVGNFIVTRAVADFGDGAVAGYSVVGRLTPLAFSLIFALSGAVGPIIGQNYGAGNYARVSETIWKSLGFAAAYTLVAWLALFVFREAIAAQFNVQGDGRAVIFAFCAIVAPLIFFNGALFVANAAFNNLSRPVWSTLLNWARNTLGVIPFVWLGATWGDAPGVLVGQAAGGVIFAVIAVFATLYLVRAYADGTMDPGKHWRPHLIHIRTHAPFSSPRC